ncbi:protein PFC0760c-like [Hydra vulgaris]|uniref:protein PFC0760c-like n=1 Tax=Hydra vulgaris TaxID=6087 RepID=UPI0032EA635C
MSESELTNILSFYLKANWQQFANYLNTHTYVIDAIDNEYNRSFLKICRVTTLYFQVNPEEKFNPQDILKTLQKWLNDEQQKNNNFKLINNLNELIIKVKNRVEECILNKKMEAIYAQVDKAIYRYGNPETETKDQVKPYEAIFVDGNSVFNLKNIDILVEKEEYDMDDIDDDDDKYSDNNNYNDDTDDDDNDDDNENEPMEIDNIDFSN